ncbi:hypothetical protein FLONG3_6615 [Fusarium longipes]|uniref:Uncharacterized protein n=1 Tax=Fusarium longipes TaxID=694270 RepID=A0A395SKI2_9HYPO|nr:hypothetical protein FLONG3_6615 [Fusarium longipes]
MSVSANQSHDVMVVNMLCDFPLDRPPPNHLLTADDEKLRDLFKLHIAKPYSVCDADRERIKNTTVVLDEETRALYHRAIKDPSSLSDDERRKVQGRRLSREKEDSYCREKCGLTMSELINKALNAPDTMSHTEARLVAHIHRPDEYGGMFNLQMLSRMTDEDEELGDRAFRAAFTKEEVLARERGQQRLKFFEAESKTAHELFDISDQTLIHKALKGPWRNHVIGLSTEADNIARYGFVVLYNKEVDWQPLHERIHKLAHYACMTCAGRLEEAVERAFTLEGVEHDDTRTPQTQFVDLRNAGKIPKGLREDAFLYVDCQASVLSNSERPFVWLWEPQDQHGPIKIDIKHVAPVLIARVMQRDLPSAKEQRGRFGRGPDIECLHWEVNRPAQLLKEGRGVGELTADGIWPPHFGVM